MAISMRLNTRRRTAVAMTTRLPRYARNDTGGTHEAGHVARTPLICHCEEHSDVAISMRLNTRRPTAVATTTRLPRYARNDTGGTHEAGHVARTPLICHCEEHSDVAISMRLNTRRRTAVAMTTRLPRYARNDRLKWVRMRICPNITVAHAVKVPESVSCNDTAWHGPGGAVSSLTIGWSA